MRAVIKGVFLRNDEGYDTQDGKHVPAIVVYDGDRDNIVINGIDGKNMKQYQPVEVVANIRQGKYGLFVSKAKENF